jgi:predicted unusual protein kinase regulating ubiquinone biosynthesis (AarF/ABC1/UbiB family)
MKTLDKIPTNKIERAGQLVKTGLKVGGNYIAYYGEKVVNPSLTKDKLNENNAEDIYDGLKNLKGSALKVAQMLSMEKNIMPKAYVEKFSLAQFSVPPLSAPLVERHLKIIWENILNNYTIRLRLIQLMRPASVRCTKPQRMGKILL